MTKDAQLQSHVLAEMKWKPSIDAAHIGVTAQDSVVTLTGQVSHYAEKDVAEAAAKTVYGVKAVANDIVVKLPGSMQRTDQDIAAAAASALKWDFEVPEQVKIVVKNGCVILEGTVDWQYQKDAAKRCVQYLMGVTAVTNSIVIKPSVNCSNITHEIEAAFRRNAELDARRTAITAHDSTVTLSENVGSWSERSEAVTAAWAAPGVASVNDQLTVIF